MNQCPYMKNKDNINQFNKDAHEMLYNNKNIDPKTASKCPYASKMQDKKQEENDSSDDEKPQGGCPVMNKGKELSKR